MRIQTFSVVAGSEACNARCPFCVSKMTESHELGAKQPEVDWRNFRKACQLAQRSGVTTAMLTGKGEPTLFPEQVTRYLEEMQPFGFPLVDLQSNGILLVEQEERYRPHLTAWYERGLSLVAISIVHYEPEKNREVYLPHRREYIDLPALIRLLHRHGLSVRLACVMASGFIDTVEEVDELIHFCRDLQVEHLTVRPLRRPEHSHDDEVASWSEAHALGQETERLIAVHLHRRGRELMRLMHGAVVYDVDGQNVCLTDCLTIDPSADDIRQLIFFPDGHLRYDWQYAGALLL